MSIDDIVLLTPLHLARSKRLSQDKTPWLNNTVPSQKSSSAILTMTMIHSP